MDYKKFTNDDASIKTTGQEKTTPDIENQIKTLPTESEPQQLNACKIFVKFMNDTQKEIDISPIIEENISELYRLVFSTEIDDQMKILKLIYRGKLLNQDDSMKSLSLESGSYIHGVINDKLVDSPENPATINNNNNLDNIINPNEGVDDPLRRQRLEQIMQEVSGILNERRDSERGTFCNFLVGYIFGAFLHIFALFVIFFFNFPRESRRGVLCGFLMHITIKFIQLQNQTK